MILNRKIICLIKFDWLCEKIMNEELVKGRDEDIRLMCKYGIKCYWKNFVYFEEYRYVGKV